MINYDMLIRLPLVLLPWAVVLFIEWLIKEEIL